VAAGVGLLAIVAVALIAVAASSLVSILVRVALLLVAVALARYVVAQDAERYRREATPGRAVAPGRHPVLIMNLRSGGVKATHFHLQEHCSHRGIEAIVLQPGDDLVALAERAVDRGADVLGMAGGDGSQALVAGVAARRGVAMVVVTAGTRNHLALDLGLDRDDVVGALDAFGEAVEQSMDLARSTGASSSTTSLWGSTPPSSAPRNTATRRSTPPSVRCPRRWDREADRSTCGSPAPTGSRTTARTLCRSRTTPTAGCRVPAPHVPT
jgi:hypothetical protein